MTAQTALRVVSLRDDPTLERTFYAQKQRIWQPYMMEDHYANKYWHHLIDDFPEWQIYLVDEAGEPIAVAQTLPCVWDGTLDGLPIGWAEGLVGAVESHQRGEAANTLMAVEISIRPESTGQGLSPVMVRTVRERAEAAGFQAVIVAVRPSLKPRYPITPMERYIHWQRPDGAPFDPWLRVHWRQGAEILHVAHPSMVIRGTVAEWEAWTGMAFPDSGDYVVDGALAPVQIDRTADLGQYVEPNVWVHHPIRTQRLKKTAV